MFKNLLNGRYGFDSLTYLLLILSLLFFKTQFWIIGAGLIGYSIYRFFSRDLHKRKTELMKFNNLINSVKNNLKPLTKRINNSIQIYYKKLLSYTTRLKQRKSFIFYKCPECNNMLRFPRNKGNLKITCPKCKYQFIKKT